MRNKISNLRMVVRIIAAIAVGLVQASTDSIAVEEPKTFFEVTNSSYINVTVSSSIPVLLRVRSVPEIITISIPASTEPANTELTVGGLQAEIGRAHV